MLEVQHPVDYLKKEEVNEPVEGEHIEQQALKRRSTLKRFKRSLDNPDLPENFEISSAIGGGDCFFDSVAKGLKQLKPNMEFTVKSIRQVCKQLAVGNQQLKAKVIRDVRSSHDPTIVLPDSSISDDELWNIYLASIEYTSEDMERMRIENSDLYRSLTSLKYGSALQTPIWGRPDIEGQLICNEYNVKLHIVEKLLHTGWSNQVVDGSVSRSVDNIDYSEVGTIHIINRGTNHFEPILDKTRITVHQSKQSLADNYHSNLGNQPIDSPQHHQINTRSPDSTDYDDEVTPEEELINTVKSNDSEEEKLEKIRRLFEKERKPDTNFQDTNGDTSLHITIRKGEGKVVELLIGKGAKINDDSVKNKRGRTPLDVAKRPDMPNGKEISGILEAYLNSLSNPLKRARTDSDESTPEDSNPKKPRVSSSDYQPMDVDVEEQPSHSKRKYAKSGLVHTLHGDIYQLKLLMLFVKRGLDRGYLFELATEMDVAEKFDDLVFKYKKSENAGPTYRFLQAKHKQDKSKKIAINDLLTAKDGEFSLQKYFTSYRKIGQNQDFESSQLKDFVICTNIGFKFCDKRADLELSENLFDKEIDKSDILDIELSRFKDSFAGKEQIISVLKNTPDLMKLAKTLVECVLDGKSISNDKSKNDLKGNHFKSYQSALIDKVINKESHKLSVDFVEGQQLSSETENLRVAFEEVFNDQRESFKLDDTPIIKNLESFALEVATLITKAQPNGVVKVEKRKHVIKDNFDKLAGYALIKKDNKIKFSTGFLNNDELPGNLNIFRRELQSKLPNFDLGQCEFKTYKDFKTCEEIYVDKDNFWEKIKEKELKLFKDFGKLDTNLESTGKFVEKFVSLLEESKSKEKKVVKIKRKDVIAKNIDKLAQYALVEKDGKIQFSSEFLSDIQLPGNLNDFRSQLRAKLEELNFDLNVLNEYQFDISNFPKFDLPDDDVNTIANDIENFLKHLRFAVNQPDEKELGEIIKEEIGKEFNYVDRKNVYGRLLEKTLDWMKEKEGSFFSHEEGKAFFEEIKKEILGTIWFNMKDPVTLFTGRKRELSDLHKALQRNQGKDKFTVISQMTSISGLGGIGKSELARKYAYDHENDYDGNVIWINAENYGTLEDSFLNLARDNRLGIPTKDRDGKEKTVEATVKEIYGFFAKRKSLFIFDNAEENEYLNKFLPLRSLTPDAKKPYVLITSRNREWEKGIEVMDLNELKLEDAIEFVRKGLGISEEDESQDQEIKNLVEKLQRFPLAIQQAIAYIEYQRVTGEFGINDYLKEYEKKTKDLLDSKLFRGIDNCYARTTFTTWKITIDKIASNEQHGKLALKILDTISYFAPENISREIFLSLAEGDEEKLKSASRLLVKYSMVNGEQKQSVLSIHRLVQEVTRLELKEQGKEQEILRQALTLVKENLKKENLDHAVSAWDHLDGKYETLVKEFCELPKKIAERLCDAGRYEESHLFEKKALPLLQEVLGGDHLEVAIMHRYLGNAYGDVGKYGEKKKNLEEAIKIFNSHLSVAKGQGGMEQEKFLEQALSTSTFKEDFKSIEAQGTENLNNDNRKQVWIRVLEIEIAKVRRNLANAYGDLGNHEKKKELLEEALSTFEEYGEELRIAETKRNLGNVYGDLGNHEKKKELLEEALSTFEEYGEELRIAETKRNLGNAYGKLGNHRERKKLLEEALPVLKKHYGLFDSKVTKAQENLSKAYKNLEYPLHGAVICGNKDKVEEELKKNDVNRKTDDLVTPLHLAVREGHSDIVKLLLEEQADPDIEDKNGETPLGLANKHLNQNPQVYQEIIKILTESINQQQKTDPINQGGEVSSEECLPGPSSGNRRKREAKGECLFTWEDVDEFNEEKDEKRDLSKIKIDSEKFVSYIKDLPKGKQSQLIQLAGEAQVTGRFQGLVNKLTSNQKVISHLNRVGKISGMTMHGMMAKNVLADFLNGDYQGVAINVGFIAGGQGFAKVAEAASIKGLKLASEGKLLLGRSLRAASPFLARGTSAFVVYDLVNQVKAFKNGTEEALVGVVGDSIYLGVDAAEIGVEVAEAFEVLEGVSSVTGPIGAAVGAVVFVGTDIYMAVKRVDKIDEVIHLTGKERFVEGLRAFIGMQPEEHIQELLQEKEVSNQLVRQGLEYLKEHSDIQSYVFPTGKSVVDSCRKVPYKTSVCDSGGLGGRCLKTRTVTRYTEKCTTKFEVDLDNTVLLDEKRTDIKWSRAKPDNPSGGELFCLPRGSHEPAPSYGSYLCENAIGITDLSTNKTGSYTLINLGEGEDYAKGFMDSANIFVVNNGYKKYYGGNKDDVFILQGSSITGYFYGEGGVNTLDLTSFAPEEESIDVKLHIGEVKDYYQDNSFGMNGINRFLGRKAKADHVFITCDSSTSDIKFVDGQGGNEEFVDHIKIYDKDCAYEMQIVVRPNTVIYNRALKGDFHYTVPYALGSTKVDFIYTAEALNLNNTFAFEYEPAQIKNVDVRNINVLNKTSHIITFNFSPMSDKEFNITISGASNPSYRLGNNTEIKVGNKGNLYMLENTNKSVDEIIKDYLVVANRLNRMSFFIQSLLSNETVAIGSGNYEVIHNNPLQKSHLVGNGGENVYVIDSESKKFEVAIPEVIIYDLDIESSVDTIDLRNLVRQVRGKLSNQDHFQLKVLKSANDLLLKATVVEVKPTEDSSVSKMRKHEYCTVRLKDGVNWYNKTHVIVDNAPMKINLDNNEWSLKPQPLMFEKDKEVIIVTSQDIEENTELITPRRAGNYSFVSDHGSDLIVTNAFDVNVAKNDLCTIVLSKFYEELKMSTLSIKFADKEIILKEHQKEISTARDVNVVKKEHKDQVYNGVFNHTKSSPEVIMLSDQPVMHRHRHSRHREQIRHRRSTSSGIRSTGWINDLFGWVRDSVGGLLSSKSVGTSNTTSSISQVDAQIDVNSTIMLLDLLIRKVTGRKYISTVDQSISSLEAQGYALNITNRFEKVLNKTAIKSGISVTNLNFDPVVVQSAIIGKIINGKFSEIAKTLYSFAKEACPEFKQTDKFLDHLKSNLEEVLAKEETMILQQKVEKPSKVLGQEVSRKVQLSKKPDTFLNGTSVVQGISRAIN